MQNDLRDLFARKTQIHRLPFDVFVRLQFGQLEMLDQNALGAVDQAVFNKLVT